MQMYRVFYAVILNAADFGLVLFPQFRHTKRASVAVGPQMCTVGVEVGNMASTPPTYLDPGVINSINLSPGIRELNGNDGTRTSPLLFKSKFHDVQYRAFRECDICFVVGF